MASKFFLRTKQDVTCYFPSSISCPILFPHFLSQLSCDTTVSFSRAGKERKISIVKKNISVISKELFDRDGGIL